MKKFLLTSILAALVAFGTTVMAQDYPDEYLGLPGDNLNLYAVMKLFQESETLEGFERNLNDQNSRINNLDLNGDNLIDYITVHDYVDGDVHNIVLRVALNRKEYQDVAVFTVQRFRDGSVQIQLVGDEALYGSNYIIEPIYDETPNPGYTGRPATRVTVVRTTTYEIATWPLVRYIFVPDYVIWRSSWYWGYYPSYWNPWRPYYWHYYYGYHYNWYNYYYMHYRYWDHPRYNRYNDFYYGNLRAHSPYVSERIREGQYRDTYSRPDQRRNGEELYTRVNPGQPRRTADNTPAVQGRRSTPQTNQERISAGTGTGTRRQVTTDTQRPVTRSSSEQNAETTRRSTTTATEKPVTRSSSEQNAETTRRSTTTATEKPVTRSSSDQNAGTARRSAPTVSERQVSRPDAGQRSQTRSTTRQSAPNVSSSPERRSRESKPSQATTKSEDKRESSGSSSSRRK